MRQSVINYVKENGIKLAANSKALKLINICYTNFNIYSYNGVH